VATQGDVQFGARCRAGDALGAAFCCCIRHIPDAARVSAAQAQGHGAIVAPGAQRGARGEPGAGQLVQGAHSSARGHSPAGWQHSRIPWCALLRPHTRHSSAAPNQSSVGPLQVEYKAASPKSVQKQPLSMPLPHLRVVAINVKTVPDQTGKAQEVVVASLVSTAMRVDGPTDTATWLQCKDMKRFTALRRLDGAAWPVGLAPAVKVWAHTRLCLSSTLLYAAGLFVCCLGTFKPTLKLPQRGWLVALCARPAGHQNGASRVQQSYLCSNLLASTPGMHTYALGSGLPAKYVPQFLQVCTHTTSPRPENFEGSWRDPTG
jgi:hypothetical protein